MSLIPMAAELGLGVTPWSPLRAGVLTGKYTRGNVREAEPGRGARVTAYLNEQTFTLLDELQRVGEQVGAPQAAVALAWVQSKPEVTATIIGARTMDQLEQNLAGLNVTLTAEDIKALDSVSEPTLNFPSGFLEMANTIMHGGATVNGEPSESWPMAPGAERRTVLDGPRRRLSGPVPPPRFNQRPGQSSQMECACWIDLASSIEDRNYPPRSPPPCPTS